MDNHVVTTLERVFQEEGFTTLRFDFRGTPSTPRGYSGVGGAVSDAVSAVGFLKSRTGVSEVGIVGYSFGASTALRLALLQPPPFLVTLSASLDLATEDGFDIGQFDGIHCPVLMFHGDSDQMIPVDDLAALAKAIGHTSIRTISLEGEGHFYQRTLAEVVTSVRNFVKEIYPRSTNELKGILK
jgi:alpha/beta superfamily hydrolase